MSWRSYKLGELLERKRVKAEIKPEKNYKLVTIRLWHNGVVLREEKKGQEIKSNMYYVNEGDFVLSGIDARNGAFGIVPKELDGAVVTNDFWCLEPKKSLLRKDFFLFLTSTKFFDYICNQCSDGTTQRIRLQKDKFYDFEIALPPVEEQGDLVKSLANSKQSNEDLSTELTHQLDLVKQLRQAFLREAMQGRFDFAQRPPFDFAQRPPFDFAQRPPFDFAQRPHLSSDESHPELDSGSTETGAELLERIKAEKAQLIKEKKIKKQKPLQPITEEEIPFEIPENWVWCRLGELAASATNGLYKPSNYYKPEGVISLRMYNIQDGKIHFEKNRRVVLNQNELETYRLQENDLLVNRVNSRELVGKTALIPQYAEPLVYESMNIRLSLVFKDRLAKYLNLNLMEQRVRDYFFSTCKIANGQVSINQSQLFEILIPLPPLSEQQRIVAKLDQLMQYCDALEASIKESHQQNELLLQQVLREALSNG